MSCILPSYLIALDSTAGGSFHLWKEFRRLGVRIQAIREREKGREGMSWCWRGADLCYQESTKENLGPNQGLVTMVNQPCSVLVAGSSGRVQPGDMESESMASNLRENGPTPTLAKGQTGSTLQAGAATPFPAWASSALA